MDLHEMSCAAWNQKQKKLLPDDYHAYEVVEVNEPSFQPVEYLDTEKQFKSTPNKSITKLSHCPWSALQQGYIWRFQEKGFKFFRLHFAYLNFFLFDCRFYGI